MWGQEARKLILMLTATNVLRNNYQPYPKKNLRQMNYFSDMIDPKWKVLKKILSIDGLVEP